MQLFIYYLAFFFLKTLFICNALSKNLTRNIFKLTSFTHLTTKNANLQAETLNLTSLENIFVLFFFNIKDTKNVFYNYIYNNTLKITFLRSYKYPLFNYLLSTSLNLNNNTCIESISLKTFKLFYKICKNKTNLLATFNLSFNKSSFNNYLICLLLLNKYTFVIKQQINYLNTLFLTLRKFPKLTFNTFFKNDAFFYLNEINLLNESLKTRVYLYIILNFFIQNINLQFKEKIILTNHTFINAANAINLNPNSQSYSAKTSHFLKNFNKEDKFFFYKTFKFLSNSFHITFVDSFFRKIANIYSIRLNPDVTAKFLTSVNLNNQKIFFLRKNKIFNKSRYSRNRQLYRTGVYWCLWLTVFLGVGIYFVFYRFTLNFGFHWWFTFIGLNSFIFNRVFKYRYYNVITLIKDLNQYLYWLFLIISGIAGTSINFFKIFFVKYLLLVKLFLKKLI